MKWINQQNFILIHGTWVLYDFDLEDAVKATQGEAIRNY